MKTLLRWCALAGRGVAALEFAITLPILMYFMGGITDFGIIYYRLSCLSTAVAAGAEYASLTDQRSPPGPALTAANVQTVMQNAATQSMPNVTTSATVVGPACYCITGSSPNSTMGTSSVTCGSTCTNGTAQKYVQLTLTSTYTPILPLLSRVVGAQTLTKTAWVPLQ
jgi:Flp pilus assembly protein TadG